MEIVIRDFSGAKLESWRVDPKNSSSIKKIFKSIKSKFNIDLFFKENTLDKDLNWLK